MVWIGERQTRAVCWIFLLIHVTTSLQEATNHTSLQGDVGGPGSGPSSESSEPRAGNEGAPEATMFGNKTFSTIRSLPSAREATNSSMEKLSQSLTRLEGSLGSLIQSFLAMQRSVSNLEQLQELLVLLLEDILKQTGNKVKSTRATKKETDENYGDLHSKPPKESNEDDNISGDADRIMANANNNAAENGAGKIFANDEDFSVISGRLGNGQGRQSVNSNTVHGKETWPSSTPLPADGNASGANSGEGGSTSEENDSSRARPPAGERRGSPQNESPNRSPQWAEPMSVERGNFLALFREALSRLVPRSSTSDDQQFQQMRLLGEDHEINAATGESPAEAPPRIFEPLEVKTNIDNFLHKSWVQERLPVQVRLSHLSQVISHAGPINGPEKSTSPFLDDLSDIAGKDYSGERPTGMINNLQLPESLLEIFNNDSSEEVTWTTNNPNITMENVSQSARKRRQAEGISGHSNVSEAITKASESKVTEKLHSATDEARSVKNLTIHDTNMTTVYNFTDSYHTGNGDGAWQDYDHLIDALLKDLSAKLQEYQNQQASSDAAIDRAVYELNKLIWVSAFESVVSPQNGSAASGSDVAHFISQPMSSAADESINKHLTFLVANETASHNATVLNSTYRVESKKKSAYIKTKEMLMEAENISTLSSHRMMEDQAVNEANFSEPSNSDWVWLTYMPSAIKMPEADLKWLTETLAILAQRQDLARDLEDITRRAWDLTQKKLDNTDAPWVDSNTRTQDEDASSEAGPEDVHDEEEIDIDEAGHSKHDPARDNASANSLFGDVSEQLTNTPNNNIDESVQQVINALKELLQQEGNQNIDQSNPKPPDRDSENDFRGQNSDALENEDGDSDDASHESNTGSHRNYMNSLLLAGQRPTQSAEYQLFAPERYIQHLRFPDYLSNKRAKRSRHKRRSGTLLKTFISPQSSGDTLPSSQQIFNPELSSMGLQTPMHQARNTSIPYSNDPQTMFHHNYPYSHLRRHSINEPLGQRLLRPFNYPFGYANYLSHMGINHPNWLHRALEPDEPSTADVPGSMDVEDALATLFQRYWQSLFDVYSRSTQTTTTTEEPDYDGESASPDPYTSSPDNHTVTSASPATVMTTDSLSLTDQPVSVKNVKRNTTGHVT